MKIYEIYFSPTGGTKKVSTILTRALSDEVTLVDLTDNKTDFYNTTLTQKDIAVIAAVAAVAEHSIACQFATDWPDAQNSQQLSEFAKYIREKISNEDTSEPAIPGNRPYKKAGGASMVPKPTKDCVKCGICAKECPVQAIDMDDPQKVDRNACIFCMRCVSLCPHSARKINPVMLSAIGLALKKVCSNRKSCELFI